MVAIPEDLKITLVGVNVISDPPPNTPMAKFVPVGTEMLVLIGLVNDRAPIWVPNDATTVGLDPEKLKSVPVALLNDGKKTPGALIETFAEPFPSANMLVWIVDVSVF